MAKTIMTAKKCLFVFGVAALLLVPRGVGAVIGTPDNVPAATLLVPYFEVDLSNGSGVTTMFSINNASATAVLAHVTLWTDLGVPTYTFDVYLTGFDVQTINLRDIFNGALPQTASDGVTQDPADTISPQGDYSQDINFASCSGVLPPPALDADFVQGLRNAHTGVASSLFSDNCTAQPLGDGIARGYVTVDTVNSCTSLKPGDPGYFTDVATQQNTIWGDYFLVDPANNFAKGDAVVHIEASQTDPLTTTTDSYTFYGHLTDTAWDASDRREAIGSTYTARFLNAGTFSGGTQLTVWRDARAPQAAFTCGSGPLGLSQQDIVAFDEQETPTGLNTLEPFPARTQKVMVNSLALPIAENFGWLYLNLKHGSGTGPSLEDEFAAQSFVSYAMDASGRFSVSQPGVMLENAADVPATTQCLGGGSPVGGRCD